MFLNPRTPLIVGTLLIVVLVGLVTMYSPMPGDLSHAHASIDGTANLEGCVSCHGEETIAKSCLNCHSEISDQLEYEKGFHHHIMKDSGKLDCATCHVEHIGEDFPLVSDFAWGDYNREVFQHPHVEFGLDGKHDTLACWEYHTRDEAFTLPAFPNNPRHQSFIGLTQECSTCHKDIHTDGLTGDCQECHGQDQFNPPAHFDHGEHFALLGGHDSLECTKCHVLPHGEASDHPLPYPFNEVRGTECAQCHETPHRAPFEDSCESCHEGSEPLWIAGLVNMTPDRHAVTGFHLEGPHAEVQCAQCHSPELAFDERNA